MLLIATSAEIENHPLSETRKKDYLDTIIWMKENIKNYDIIWIECIKESNSFIEEYYPVFYSNCHIPTYTNIGSNWGRALEKFLDLNNITQEYITHLTGRYHFLDQYYFEKFEENFGYDLYANPDEHEQYRTGCFTLRTKYFKDWIKETDWEYMNYIMLNLEKSLWNYSKQKKLKFYEYDKLHMEWNIFGKGNPSKALV